MIFGSNDGIGIVASSTGTFTESESLIVKSENNTIYVGIGTYNPTEKLSVEGNVKAAGFIQFGSLSTAERDALTPANGMVIYNTTASKFQGYAGAAWVDLH